MTFKLVNYALSKDVVSSLRKQMVNPKLFSHAPLIVMNNFTGEGLHINLMATMFQNMFPTINVMKVIFWKNSIETQREKLNYSLFYLLQLGKLE